MNVIAVASRALADRAVEAARTLTRNGEAIDDHQVVVERVAYAATEARVIAELAEAPASLADAARVAAAELAVSIRNRLEPIAALLGIDEPRFEDAARVAIFEATAPAAVEKIGEQTIASEGRLTWPLDETLTEVRTNVRAFAEREVAPHAERIHHHDELVP